MHQRTGCNEMASYATAFVIDDGEEAPVRMSPPVALIRQKRKASLDAAAAWGILLKFINPTSADGASKRPPAAKGKKRKSSGKVKKTTPATYHYDGDQNDAASLEQGRLDAKKAMEEEDEQLRLALSTVRTYVPDKGASERAIQAFVTESKTSLVPCLVRLFSNDSLADWIKRFSLYNEALNVVRKIAMNVFCVKLLLNVSALLSRIKNQAATFSRLNMAAASSNVVEQEQIMSCSVLQVSETVDKFLAKAKGLQLLELSEASSSGAQPGSNKRAKRSHRTSSSSSVLESAPPGAKSEMTVEEAQKQYVSRLKEQRFEMVSTPFKKHMYLEKVKSGSFHNPKKIMAELSSLHASLPVHWASSIFVKSTEQCNLLKALIIGPPDTPYENGCFEFDIFLPNSYPEESPKVLLVTTGGGRVRFNPNLYADGKVCLSLLGTWQGPGWIPKESTLLQVLMSIQSLILVKDPYFNEPGFEKTRTTAEGRRHAEAYSKNIRSYTLQWAMLEQLQKANESPFKDIITKHFQMKYDSIKEQLDAWKTKVSALALKVAAQSPMPKQVPNPPVSQHHTTTKKKKGAKKKGKVTYAGRWHAMPSTWLKYLDLKEKRVFYYNTKTKQVQWDEPQKSGAGSPAPQVFHDLAAALEKVVLAVPDNDNDEKVGGKEAEETNVAEQSGSSSKSSSSVIDLTL